MIIKDGSTIYENDTLYIYFEDSTVIKGGKLSKWYTFLKWREKLDEESMSPIAIEKVEYILEKESFPFVYNGKNFIFYPDFSVKYKGIFNKEYQTLSPFRGRHGKMYARILHKYPQIILRIIEPIEYKKIMHNFERIIHFNFGNYFSKLP